MGRASKRDGGLKLQKAWPTQRTQQLFSRALLNEAASGEVVLERLEQAELGDILEQVGCRSLSKLWGHEQSQNNTFHTAPTAATPRSAR